MTQKEIDDFELDLNDLKAKFDQDFPDELVDDNSGSENNSDHKKQIILMIKKINLMTNDTLKLIKHYKKILDAGHIIPVEIIRKLDGMTNQLIKTAKDLTIKSESLSSNSDNRLKNVEELLNRTKNLINE